MLAGDKNAPPINCMSVSELTRIIKARLESASDLQQILVKGEISNFKHHTSGHMYFTLKDAQSRIRCVMFRYRSRMVRFALEDGMTVIVRGSVSVYENSGDYQLYVDQVYPVGQGALFLAFEQLKQRLEKEGLFREERKRPLPFFPKTVGVVTSPTGAAVRDIISVLRRRNPGVNILLAPALVQGEGGPAAVTAAIELMNQVGLAEVLIVGRGGGSLEELWTFNDESVARAIAASAIPVVSAVGHETDFTIADFVADRRAPTPSAAAEMVVPERDELVRHVQTEHLRMVRALLRAITLRRERLRLLMARPALLRPTDRLYQLRQRLDDLGHGAEAAMRRKVYEERAGIEVLAGRLNSLSPLATLARGYAICQDTASGAIVRSIAQAPQGSRLLVRVHDGSLACRVEDQLPFEEQDLLR
ncbi:MAG: exodeoxyribonuclease VII large subunit [Limnochordia bacterium]